MMCGSTSKISLLACTQFAGICYRELRREERIGNNAMLRTVWCEEIDSERERRKQVGGILEREQSL